MSALRLKTARRGVLLLVVLALLAMFGTVAITFVVIAGQAKRGAQSASRAEQIAVSPESELSEAMMQVIRGSTNPASALAPHSLLEDLYGSVDWVSPTTGLTFAKFTPVTGQETGLLKVTGWSATASDSLYLARRIGCVLTMLTGEAAGHSTRIVGFDPSSNASGASTTGYVLAFPNEKIPSNSDQFIINGLPFAGAGFGYNSSTGVVDKTVSAGSATNVPLALLPDYAGVVKTTAALTTMTEGGANEDYDAPDYQNWHMAMVLPDGAVPIPSFHRPEVIKYLKNKFTWDDTLHQYASLRPVKGSAINPNFTGSNPGTYSADWDGITTGSNYSWDVDNDGDGKADSVWLDLGMPPRTDGNGQTYKPLFAILCVDMDGRMNVNAHGCLAQTKTDYYKFDVPSSLTFAGASSSLTTISRGQGVGPAEINLAWLCNSSYATPGSYTAFLYLLQGYGSYYGRYGSTQVPPVAASVSGYLGVNKFFEFPAAVNESTVATATHRYGSPVDLKGAMAVAVDTRGQPVYGAITDGTGAAFTGGWTKNPYLLNPSLTGRDYQRSDSGPMLFSPSELEGLLRYYDRDASTLAPRLVSLLKDGGSLSNDPGHRNEVTTDSWSIPVPPVSLSSSLRTRLNTNVGTRRARHPYELIKAMGVSDARARELLPWDFVSGLRMDVARVLGNATLDSTSSVVDNPTDSPASYTNAKNISKYYTSASGTSATDIACNASNGVLDYTSSDATVLTSATGANVRQLLARHLYILAMVFSADVTNDSSTWPWSSETERAKYCAQWAVNVVDFCDRDSIMTKFDYDPDPFNTAHTAWDSTYCTSTVWGCERPELLITETLALHARRTEDLKQDTSGTTDHSTATVPIDGSFDSRLRPLASLFVELYNPWGSWNSEGTPSVEVKTGDLSTTSTISGKSGVALDKATPSSHPVWRLVVVPKTANFTSDPDSSATSVAIGSDWRVVYFCDPTGLPGAQQPTGRTYNRNSSSAAIAPILPGRYAVVGPGPSFTKNIASGTTVLFAASADPETNATPGAPASGASAQTIVLTPSTNLTANQVVINGNEVTTVVPDGKVATDVVPMTAVVVDQPSDQRMSISEPVGGYGTPTTTPLPNAWSGANCTYTPAIDSPLDSTRTDDIFSVASNTKVYFEAAMVYLQRLANPLADFDATNNPYRTVDSMPTDLFMYNGVSFASTGYPAAPTELGVTEDATTQFQMCSRQRGNSSGNGTATNANLWLPEPWTHVSSSVSDSSKIPSTNTYPYPIQLQHTLGFINKTYGFTAGATPVKLYRTTASDEYQGEIDPTLTTNARPPWPWLVWHNRPPVNPYELLYVPWVNSSQLLSSSNTTTPFNIVASGSTSSVDPYTGTTNPQNPFPYLPNFFFSGAGTPQLHRILEFLRTPSPFVGCEVNVPPKALADTSTYGPNSTHHFHPPYNMISTYREPGRINLNTITSPNVYNALMNGYPGLADTTTGNDYFMKSFIRSRRGYGGSGSDWRSAIAQMDSGYPTRFANPFRSFAGKENVPPGPNWSSAIGSEVNCGLLRQDPANTKRALFQGNDTAATSPTNTDRNPFFRYQGIQRLANLVTTQSNVYAVWVTVGYFQCDTDGSNLGAELGTDSGEVKRHRAFFMYDRSIPVGFQRGYDLNSEKGILVKRYIE